MTIVEAVQAARSKLDEGTFFLQKMREITTSSHHNLAEAEIEFGYYLSAFLSAARSVPQIISKGVGWPAINAVRGS